MDEWENWNYCVEKIEREFIELTVTAEFNYENNLKYLKLNVELPFEEWRSNKNVKTVIEEQINERCGKFGELNRWSFSDVKFITNTVLHRYDIYIPWPDLFLTHSLFCEYQVYFLAVQIERLLFLSLPPKNLIRIFLRAPAVCSLETFHFDCLFHCFLKS